jgi:hypothetical protein
MNCLYQNNSRLCPKYHADEVNRKSFVEKILMMTNNENSANGTQNQFNLDLFKVRPCTKKNNHNLKICDYYHHDKDRRRPTNIFSYQPPICSFVSRNATCPNGENCRFAHNKLEQLYHPERYKRKFCVHHPHNIHKCEYGGYCSFAHNETEIVIELLHNMKQDEYFYLYKYKTVFCPYIYEHDRNQCVYAHNPQDLRRDPNQSKYNAVQCVYWSQGQIFSYDEGGCPSQMDCENCHGWKELEYHPLYYKTKPCNNGKKCNKKDCPFYHSNAERRQVKVTSQLTSQLTKSLFLLKNPDATSPLQQKSFSPEPSQPFEAENMRMTMENKMEQQNYSKNMVAMFMPFKIPESDNNSKKNDYKPKRFGESSSLGKSLLPSTNHTEDELLLSMPGQPRVQQEYKNGRYRSTSGVSTNSDRSKLEITKSLFSQSLDPWAPFHQGHEDKVEDYITNPSRGKLAKPDLDSIKDNSFDFTDIDGQEKQEIAGERLSSGLTNDQFKKTFIRNLEKKGLNHTKQYLINPMIDLKALKSFSQKDFHLFPHISVEDKKKIVKIIQDVLDEEALFSEVKTINDEDEENLFKQLGSFDRDQDVLYNLTSQLERYSYQ